MADDRGSVPTSYLLKDDPYVKTVVESGETLITQTGSDLYGCLVAFGDR